MSAHSRQVPGVDYESDRFLFALFAHELPIHCCTLAVWFIHFRYRDPDFLTEVNKLQSYHQEAEPATDANANSEIVTRSVVNRLEKTIEELEEEKK